MTAFRIFLSRLIGWLGGKKRDADLRAEIDAHIALGAHSTNVRSLIIRQGMALTAVGLVVGLAASLLAAPVLQSLLVKLPVADRVTFAGVSILLLAIALVACYVPARRATRIDPIATLRAE